jgi:hypothetical protein
MPFDPELLSASIWRVAVSSGARGFASIRTWKYRDSMARETCPAILMIASSLAARLNEFRDQPRFVHTAVALSALAAIANNPIPRADKSPPPARAESKESPSLPEPVTVTKKMARLGISWAFR